MAGMMEVGAPNEYSQHERRLDDAVAVHAIVVQGIGSQAVEHMTISDALAAYQLARVGKYYEADVPGDGR